MGSTPPASFLGVAIGGSPAACSTAWEAAWCLAGCAVLALVWLGCEPHHGRSPPRSSLRIVLPEGRGHPGPEQPIRARDGVSDVLLVREEPPST